MVFYKPCFLYMTESFKRLKRMYDEFDQIYIVTFMITINIWSCAIWLGIEFKTGLERWNGSIIKERLFSKIVTFSLQ